MAINETGLIQDLNNIGTLVIQGQNNSRSYIVVVDDIANDTSVDDIITIVESYIVSDFPFKQDVTLVNGLFKCLYTNSQ